MRDLAFILALLGVLAGIVHLATRTKRLPDEPYREPEDGVQPWDSYAAALARRKDR